MPEDARPALRRPFRDYLERRIGAHRDEGDAHAAAIVAADTSALQKRIWDAAVAASGRPEMPTSTRQLLLPALNEMFDITTTRAAATRNHPPAIILALLVGLCLLSALIVGQAAAMGTRRAWFDPVVFSTTMALTLYVVFDLECPRHGLIRVDAADETRSELRPALRND